MSLEKPLFIPLKSEFFNQFKDGSKTVEYRKYGARWNERICRIGRPVVLSKGYGKKERLHGVVKDFRKVPILRSKGADDLLSLCGWSVLVAEIEIELQP